MASSPQPKELQPHHEQQSLCTTRLPYRQGRKLTAVKTYTITNESNVLLVFGVPSINIQHEIKSTLQNFGKILQFTKMDLPSEAFTETYLVRYDNIKAARMAKRILDTNNFYGGTLHITYAPEYESISETQFKLELRRQDICNRLKKLKKEKNNSITEIDANPINNRLTNDNKEINTVTNTDGFNDMTQNSNNDITSEPVSYNLNLVNTDHSNGNNETAESSVKKKLNMGMKNTIYLQNKRKKPSSDKWKGKKSKTDYFNDDIEVVDCTSTERDLVTDIKLNYNNFGNEIIRKVETKPLNKINFSFNNK